MYYWSAGVDGGKITRCFENASKNEFMSCWSSGRSRNTNERVKTCALVESGDGPQTCKNVYCAGPLGTLETLEHMCFACVADIATLCQNTCFLQFKDFPSIIPSMGRFGTVTSVGAKCSPKSAEHESVLKFIGPQRFLAPPLKLAPPITDTATSPYTSR